MSQHIPVTEIAKCKVGERVSTQFLVVEGLNDEGEVTVASLHTGDDGTLVNARETETGARKGETALQRALNSMASQVSTLGLRTGTYLVTAEMVVARDSVPVAAKTKTKKPDFEGLEVNPLDPFGDKTEEVQPGD